MSKHRSQTVLHGAAELRLIKRYKNRKLYDTRSKRYITLLDVSRMISDGHQVEIVDNDTGNDLTSLTLAQIILEQQKNRTDSIPLFVLMGLIQRNGVLLLEWLLSPKHKSTKSFEWFSYQEVAKALDNLNLPTRADLLQLSSQIDELEIKIEELRNSSFQI